MMVARGSAWLLCVFVATFACAQPRRTACLQWDQAYNQLVVVAIVAAAILAVLIWLIASLALSPLAWWAASPRPRIWICAVAAGTLVELLIVVWPRVIGFGRGIFTAVAPEYLDCQAVPFGAPGLLRGLIGEGVPAFSQWPAISGLVYGAALAGGALAWLASEAIVRASGLQAVARGEEA